MLVGTFKRISVFFIYEIIDKSRGELATFLWRFLLFSRNAYFADKRSEWEETWIPNSLWRKVVFPILPTPSKKSTHETWMSNLINSAKVAQKWSRAEKPLLKTPLDNGKVVLGKKGIRGRWSGNFVPCGAKLTICVQCAKKISRTKTKTKMGQTERPTVWVWSIFPGTFGRFGSLATPPDSSWRALA